MEKEIQFKLFLARSLSQSLLLSLRDVFENFEFLHSKIIFGANCFVQNP